jgi:hypothetical protein
MKVDVELSNPIPFCPIWGTSNSFAKEKTINVGLSKYVEFCKLGMCNDETYFIKTNPYKDYWENIL